MLMLVMFCICPSVRKPEVRTILLLILGFQFLVGGSVLRLAGSICRSQSANERAETRFCRLETNIYQSKNWWINWLSNRNQEIIHCRTSTKYGTLTKVPNVDGIPHKTAVFYMNKGLCGPRVCHTHRTKTWEDNGNRIRWRMDIFHSK